MMPDTSVHLQTQNFKSIYKSDHMDLNSIIFPIETGPDEDFNSEEHFFVNLNSVSQYYSEDQYNNCFKSDNKISIIHFNSRSLYANFQNIKEYLNQFTLPFNIILISETWMRNERGTDFGLEGYNFVYRNRENKNGGGVAMFIDKNLHYKIIDNLSVAIDDLLECITIEINRNNKRNMIVSCVYRTPGSNIQTFKDWMEANFTIKDNKIMFIGGDFNIDLLNQNSHIMTDEFINTMYSIGLYPKITRPSRITRQSATLIDNIFSNDLDNCTIGGLLINDISDHLPVFTVYNNTIKKNVEEIPLYRRIKTVKVMEAFKKDLSKQDWNLIYNEKNDTEKAYNDFLKIFLTLYNKNCPIIKFKKKQKHQHNGWMTKGLINACKKKNCLYKHFLKKRTKESEEKYKTYKNKLTMIIRNSKKDYYHNLLEKSKNNTKDIWNILNKIIKNSSGSISYPLYFIENEKNIKNSEEIANKLNSFFVNVGPNLEKEIKKTGTEEGSLIDRNINTMVLNPIVDKEILNIVNQCKNKTSTDFNDLDMKVIKYTIESIVKPLTHIFNLSLQNGQFPHQMKIAKVIPLYKTGDKHHFTNYRPVSLLPQFSKILEKVFNNRLESFLEEYHLLSDQQYGFRANRSTSHALIELTEEITNAMDRKLYCVGVFVDLSKAFDTINHEILFNKLEKYGIRGVALQWLKSYLQNRQQFVKMGAQESECLDIVCGLPQGSVLGPKLFNIYINDIVRTSKILKFILFADDTNIIGNGENLQELLRTITQEFINIKAWLDMNKLSINLNKTKIMIFGNKAIKYDSLIQIESENIERVTECKFLGVIIDDQISWGSHIRHISIKISRNISVMAKAKYYLNNKALHLLFCSLILPYLTYCALVWGNTYTSYLQPLFRLQKRAIRIIHRAGYLEHTNPLFITSKIMKFFDIVDFQLLQFMYKARYKLLPNNLENMFYERDGGYNLRDELNFKFLIHRTLIKKKSIAINGVKLWNKLSTDLKQCPDIKQFKNKYKQNIFKKYNEET